MIKLKDILLESKTKEENAIDYIGELIKNTEFAGKTYVAGGYVRDMVMGKKSKDIDITVALPEGGIKLANFITKKSGVFKKDINPVVFKRFGTAKFNLRGVKYNGVDLSGLDIECVMTRKEKYTDGDRKPEVDFGTIEQDVERRDLTINSLIYDISNHKILDLTGKGIDDIKNRVIRTPIDSDIIFKEDPLRMLRVIRFSTRYGWELSKDMIESLRKNAKMLEFISAERKQEELNKILLSNTPDEGIRIMIETGLMKYVIPELYGLRGMTQNRYHAWDALNHTLEVLKKTPAKLETRLGALLHDIGKVKTRTDDEKGVHFYNHEEVSATMSRDILKRLKYPVALQDKVAVIVGQHMRTKDMGNDVSKIRDKVFRKLVKDLGDNLEDTLDVIDADNKSHGPIGWTHNLEKQIDIIRDRIKNLGKFTAKTKMPVDGNMIMRLFNMKPGKDVGKMLSIFEDYFLEDPDKILSMSDQEIESLLKQMYEQLNKERTNEKI
jgi:poly(A) polymerase